jgi:Arc/MetJ family transcription regulator
VVVRVRGQYEEHLEELELRHVDPDGTPVDGDPRALAAVDSERRLRLALLADKRSALVRLRQQRRIDDLVLQRVQAQLDVEEVRLALLADKRSALVRLRQQRRIDDLVLQRVQAQLDVEEVRLAGAGDEE